MPKKSKQVEKEPKSPKKDFSKPMEVQDVDIAFPARALELMPEWDDIPEEFRNSHANTPWHQFFRDWMYRGVYDMSFHMKDGVDGNTAYRHLQCVIGSFAPEHQHKEAAFAYLCSLWFTTIEYKKGKKEDGPPDAGPSKEGNS